jgi:hypothetical protein
MTTAFVPTFPVSLLRLAGPNGTSRPLLNRQGRGHRHAMTPEDVNHLRTVGGAAGGSNR